MGDYAGSFRIEAVSRWVRRNLEGVIKYLPTSSSLEAFRNSRNESAVGYFPSVKVEYLEAFRSVARESERLSFAYSSEAEIGLKLGLDSDAIIVSIRGDTHILLTNLDRPSELKSVIDFLVYPEVVNVDFLWIQDLLKSSFPVLFVYSEGPLGIDNRTIKAVRDSGLLLGFVDCDSTEKILEHLSEFLGANSCPSMWILEEPLNADTMKFHRILTENITSEHILDMVSQYSQRQLERFVKSDPVEPASPHEARVVVGSEWTSFIQSEKRKFVLFYAPWCSFCIDILEAFDELAQDVPTDVIVAKMDKSRNDSPGFQVSEYPTIVLFLPGTIEGHRRYTGPMTKQSLREWVVPQREDL